MINSPKIGGIFDIPSRQKELDELKAKLTDQAVWNDHKLAGEINSQITAIEKEIGAWEELQKQISDLKELTEMSEDEEDESMIVGLEKEFDKAKKKLENMEIQIMFSGESDSNNAFLNIHPGAGGTESQDWGDMLLRMYQRWAERQNFSVDLINYDPGDVAGLKDATLYIRGRNAYGYLRSENGIHRLVRLSPFNANNKRQTSFCAVTVSPEVSNDINIDIDEKDIRIDTYRSSGAGGQHVNKTDSAVRITHFPSGIVVTCQNERSQHQNKDMAMRVLKSRLYDYEMEKRDKEQAMSSPERKNIEWGNQIRSYVFQPYTLAKDHRTNYEKGNIQAVMDGEIDEFIFAYLKNTMNLG